MVDTIVLGTIVERRLGSSPSLTTNGISLAQLVEPSALESIGSSPMRDAK